MSSVIALSLLKKNTGAILRNRVSRTASRAYAFFAFW